MNDPAALRAAVLERLAQVIDPETGVDIIRMRLIEELAVDEKGHGGTAEATCQGRDPCA